MSKKKASDSYEVGYGKPPESTRFQKGMSGNPRGRPKKALDFDQALIRESKSFITITENGRRKRITRHEVAIKQLMKEVMTGRTQSQRIYFPLHQQALERAALEAGSQPNNSGKYKAEDLTDDQLAEIILTGGLKKKK
jgi:hypothetical protein